MWRNSIHQNNTSKENSQTVLPNHLHQSNSYPNPPLDPPPDLPPDTPPNPPLDLLPTSPPITRLELSPNLTRGGPPPQPIYWDLGTTEHRLLQDDVFPPAALSGIDEHQDWWWAQEGWTEGQEAVSEAQEAGNQHQEGGNEHQEVEYVLEERRLPVEENEGQEGEGGAQEGEKEGQERKDGGDEGRHEEQEEEVVPEEGELPVERNEGQEREDGGHEGRLEGQEGGNVLEEGEITVGENEGQEREDGTEHQEEGNKGQEEELPAGENKGQDKEDGGHEGQEGANVLEEGEIPVGENEGQREEGGQVREDGAQEAPLPVGEVEGQEGVDELPAGENEGYEGEDAGQQRDEDGEEVTTSEYDRQRVEERSAGPVLPTHPLQHASTPPTTGQTPRPLPDRPLTYERLVEMWSQMTPEETNERLQGHCSLSPTRLKGGWNCRLASAPASWEAMCAQCRRDFVKRDFTWRTGCFGDPSGGKKCSECSSIGRNCSWIPRRAVRLQSSGNDALQTAREEGARMVLRALGIQVQSIPDVMDHPGGSEVGGFFHHGQCCRVGREQSQQLISL